jgi:uncharacterized protein
MTRAGRPPHPERVAPSATAPGAAEHPDQASPTPGSERWGPGPGEGPVGPLAGMLIVIVRAYQRWISPMLAPSCRFYPSCSTYAVTAIARHGAVRGSALALWRLLRCHPFNRGGVDQVPARSSDRPRWAKTR